MSPLQLDLDADIARISILFIQQHVLYVNAPIIPHGKLFFDPFWFTGDNLRE